MLTMRKQHPLMQLNGLIPSFGVPLHSGGALAAEAVEGSDKRQRQRDGIKLRPRAA